MVTRADTAAHLEDEEFRRHYRMTASACFWNSIVDFERRSQAERGATAALNLAAAYHPHRSDTP